MYPTIITNNIRLKSVSCSWCANWIFDKGGDRGIYTRKRFNELPCEKARDMEGDTNCNHLKYGSGWGYTRNTIMMIREYRETNNRSKGCPYSCLHKDDEIQYEYVHECTDSGTPM